MATRRTHIVRISDADEGEETKDSNYFDVEVLEAVAFRTDNGKEMVLNLPTDKAVPYIVDDTGGGHEKKPANGTRRSHMKRITSGKNKIDAEILDCVAFTGENGEAWILNLPAEKADPYDVTEGSGTSKSTRRTHEEKLYPDKNDKTRFITIERSDMMAFRTINGKEMIIKMESHDDGGQRADTHIVSPEGYDPDNEDGPEPPRNTDAHHYIKFVDGVTDIITDKEKIAQGPLWWIRKVKESAGGWAIITAVSYGGAPGITVHSETGADPTILYDKTITRVIPGAEGQTFVYTSPPQQQLVWHNGPDTPFFTINGTPIHIYVPSGFYNLPARGYNSFAEFILAWKRYHSVPNAPVPQGFACSGMPGTNHPPSQNGIIKQPWPGAGSRDNWSYPDGSAYGTIFLTPKQEAALWVQYFIREKALTDAWEAGFVAAELAQDTSAYQDINAPGYSFPSEGNGATVFLAETATQQFGSETLHFRQVIVKLKGTTTNLILDLSLPLPAPIDNGDGSFSTGVNSSALVEVISEWPTPPSTAKFVLPITSDATGALNEPPWQSDDIAGNGGGSKSDGWTGGTYTLKITTSEADPIAPKTKKKKVLKVTPAFPGMFGGTGIG